jgi:hypothetical protein
MIEKLGTKIHSLVNAARRVQEARKEVKAAYREINDALKAEGLDWRVKYCTERGYIVYLPDQVRLRLKDDGFTIMEGEAKEEAKEIPGPVLALITDLLATLKFYRETYGEAE